MRTLTLLILALLAGSQAVSGEIYRHADKYGNPVFTDQPPEGAEAVQIGPVNRMPRTEVPQKETAPAAPAAVAAEYKSLLINGVQQGDTLINPQGDLAISAVADIPVQEQLGHRVVFIHNGKAIDQGGGYTISRIDRGQHSFTAEIRDADGQVLIRSEPIVIQVIRTSVPPARARPR